MEHWALGKLCFCTQQMFMQKTIRLNWDCLKILSRKVLITNHTHTWEIPWEFLNWKLELEKSTRLLNGQPRSLMQQSCRTHFFRKWGPAVQWRIIPQTAFPNLFSLIEVQTWPLEKIKKLRFCWVSKRIDNWSRIFTITITLCLNLVSHKNFKI
jgi:hypothetical protein